MKKTKPDELLDQEAGPSKSELKRQMLELQELGKKILALNNKQRASLPLTEELQAALVEHDRIKSHEARRRQLQRIGKLMRSADAPAIQQAVDLFDASSDAYAQHFQQLEHWRERLLDEEAALAEFINAYPECEVQKLRQLIRNARKERDQNKPPASSRKLFRYLRELAETQ